MSGYCKGPFFYVLVHVTILFCFAVNRERMFPFAIVLLGQKGRLRLKERGKKEQEKKMLKGISFKYILYILLSFFCDCVI